MAFAFGVYFEPVFGYLQSLSRQNQFMLDAGGKTYLSDALMFADKETVNLQNILHSEWHLTVLVAIGEIAAKVFAGRISKLYG